MANSKKHYGSLISNSIKKKKLKRSIAFVTSDLKGPIRNGGVGTACAALAQCLAVEGHSVTILFASRSQNTDRDFYSWQHQYSKMGIDLQRLPEPYLNLEGLDPARVSYAVYLFLRNQKYDIVHFPDMHGLGYYSALAKKLNLSFCKTLLCVTLHGPSIWAQKGNQLLLGTPEDLLYFYLERKSVELSDVLIAPSQYILNWALEKNWILPTQVYCEQLPVIDQKDLHRKAGLVKLSEIVFFGRLETRKGLIEFCDAIDLLILQNIHSFSVTFLGTFGIAHWEPAAQYLQTRGRQWPIKWQVISDFGQEEALRYLGKRDILAVIPSLEESMGYTVVECIKFGIPFIASLIPPFQELIDSQDHSKVLFENTPVALSRKIKEVFKNGVKKVNFAKSPTKTLNSWLDWHSSVDTVIETNETNFEPLVSVCLTHRNRPFFLDQCLQSLSDQTYKNFEVILMDDASDLKIATSYLRSLKLSFQKKGWQISFQKEVSGPCILRNKAARLANGKYLLFMDDDNIAKPEEIETFVKCAEISQADLLTCPFDRFSGIEVPSTDTKPISRWLPVGDIAGLSLFYNLMGDMNFFVKKEVYEILNGLKEVRNIGSEDAEFLARAILRGYKLVVVPEALFWYRTHNNNFSDQVKKFESMLLRMNPFYEISSNPDFQQLISMTMSMWFKLYPNRPGPNSTPLFNVNRVDVLKKKGAYGRRLYPSNQDSGLTDIKACGTLKIKKSDTSIIMATKKSGGFIEIPKLNLSGVQRLLVEIELLAPCQSVLEINYKDKKYPKKIQSVKKSFEIGPNNLQFYLDSLEFVGPIHIVPAAVPMDIAIKRIEIFAEA